MSEVRNLSVRRVFEESPDERAEWIDRIAAHLDGRRDVTIKDGGLYLSVPIEVAFEHLTLSTLQKLWCELSRTAWQVTMEFVRGEFGDRLGFGLDQFRDVIGEPDKVVPSAGDDDSTHPALDLDVAQPVKKGSGCGVDLHQSDAGQVGVAPQGMEGRCDLRVQSVSVHPDPLVPRRSTPPP